MFSCSDKKKTCYFSYPLPTCKFLLSDTSSALAAMPIKLKAQVHRPKQLVKNIKRGELREKPEFYSLPRPFDTENVVWSSKYGHSK